MKFKTTFLIVTSVLLTLTTSAQTCTQVGADIDGEAAGDNSGGSVSLSSDGSTVAIGATYNDGNGEGAGHVRIYKNVSGTWTQQGSDIDGEAAIDLSGSVSLSSDGSTVAIGARLNDGSGADAGHVRIYKNISGTWTQQGSDINGEAAGDYFGGSVSLSSDGSTVAIGAQGNDGNGASAGHVRVYKNISGTWTQQGSDIDGEAADDYSGSVSLSSDGSTVAIGAWNNNGNFRNSSSAGHVRIYKNVSGTWTQQGSDIDGEATSNSSGTSVSLSSDGSTVAIGAPANNSNGSSAGHVRIYKNVSGTWTQQGSDIDGEAAGDRSGQSVSLSSDGSTVAIGAKGNDGNGSYSGHVRIYKNISGTWTQQGSDIDGEAASDYCGSVSLSSDGSTVAIGAYANDGNRKVNVGHVRVYSISTCITISSTDTVTSCGAYTWTNGVTYTESNNTALDTFVNGLGCDSIVTLNLTINSSSSFTDNITACDSFKWTDGNNYTSSNTTALDTFVNAVGCDSIVTLNLTILKSTTSQVTDQVCDEYASASGRKWYTSGTYTDTIVNAIGCDSIITYVLTIIDTDAIITSQPIDSTFNISSDARFGVSSQYNDAAYQWETDLGFGFQILTDALQYSGANTRVLTIGSITMINNNQPFRVIVSASNCIDTSDIATLTVRDNASIDGRLSSNLLSVYPNPATDLITIDVDGSLLGKPFEIYNTKGQVVTIGTLSSVNTTIDLEDYKSGIYFIKVGDEQQYSIKLIKE